MKIKIWVLGMLRWFGLIWPKWAYIWARLHRGHRWMVGVRDPLKTWSRVPVCWSTGYVRIKFHNYSRLDNTKKCGTTKVLALFMKLCGLNMYLYPAKRVNNLQVAPTKSDQIIIGIIIGKGYHSDCKYKFKELLGDFRDLVLD